MKFRSGQYALLMINICPLPAVTWYKATTTIILYSLQLFFLILFKEFFTLSRLIFTELILFFSIHFFVRIIIFYRLFYISEEKYILNFSYFMSLLYIGILDIFIVKQIYLLK